MPKLRMPKNAKNCGNQLFSLHIEIRKFEKNIGLETTPTTTTTTHGYSYIKFAFECWERVLNIKASPSIDLAFEIRGLAWKREKYKYGCKRNIRTIAIEDDI